MFLSGVALLFRSCWQAGFLLIRNFHQKQTCVRKVIYMQEFAPGGPLPHNLSVSLALYLRFVEIPDEQKTCLPARPNSSATPERNICAYQ